MTTKVTDDTEHDNIGKKMMTGEEEEVNEDKDDDDDNHCNMSTMLMKSINHNHGSGSNSNINNDNNNDVTNQITNQQQQQQQQANKDARHQFIHSRKGRNYYMDEKQLRIQLWDAFRLTRVILGTPIKDKVIQHNAILHSIQQVAEMKIQLFQMSEQIDSYQQQQQQQIDHYQQRRQANYKKYPSVAVRDVVRSKSASDNNNNNNKNNNNSTHTRTARGFYHRLC
mmetsp:Transcript_30389/g.34012  ORF Transcript_30389/g.34012 Transcript_30389/m.34012 type:complete len:225 (+) Transcript_30389:472-1146(+)